VNLQLRGGRTAGGAPMRLRAEAGRPDNQSSFTPVSLMILP
jgi:hypothetical protein